MSAESEKGEREMAELTAEERLRYERQLLIRGWGDVGQLRLKSATVGVIGAGGLGSPLLYYLTSAGVGRLVICDKDVVSITDLNRQILYGTEDAGHYKLAVAQAKLKSLNPNVNIECRIMELTAENIEEVFGNVDCLVDCLDNFPTRFIINEFAVRRKIPLIHSAVWG
ncbi:MAG: HesA/MoeB/ThiF family protein, partial [Candidatus Sumerlaeia bacterium]|nr:HesA/MoeB/ThiF family protein [Candidatus Sumerlaeia bacterium]